MAWLLGIVAQALRQPPLLAYLLGGFIIGPSALGWLKEVESVEAISELGLLFLLFMVGLEIDLKKIASAGPSITVTAISQILGGFLLGLGLFSLAGFPLGTNHRWDALYLAVACAMSSTVIIVKVLYDRRELDTLAGRLTLGVLVIQDLFAILFLAVQPSLEHLRPQILLASLLRVIVLIAVALALSRYLLPRIFHRVARLPELVLVGAIAWCFGVGELADQLSLSREMGALIAGVAISTFPYALDVTAKVTSLRDFFVTLFFVGLGLQMKVPTGNTVLLGLGIAVFTVLSRFVATFTPLFRMKFGLRTSLLPSIYLGQISEFSLVVVALGAARGHLSDTTQGAVALAFVFLALASTLAMTYSDSLVRRLIVVFRRIGIKDLDSPNLQGHDPGKHGDAPRILLLGFYRTASSLLAAVTTEASDILPQLAVIDFNPLVHTRLRQRGIRAIYGDISQRETLIHAGIQSASIIICTVPDSLLKGTNNLRLVRQLRALNPEAAIFAPAETLGAVKDLEEAGASFVSLGRVDEAETLFRAVRATQAGFLKEFRDIVTHRHDASAEVVE
jgi:Kef-type K+ transport system membrane component KefB